MKPLILIISFLFSQESSAQYNQLIRELSPPKIEMSQYDQATALYFAQLSEIAYWSNEQIQELLKEESIAKMNIQYKLIENYDGNRHDQALLWCTKEFMVVAFRGTEPTVWKDWFIDSKYWNYENTADSDEELAHMPPGHGGFRWALRALMQKGLFSEIDSLRVKCSIKKNKGDFPVYLTGHSLGAAISQMFIEPLNYRGYLFGGAYHFAPPLAVSCAEQKYMKDKYGNKVYDIVNYKDYVPRAARNNVAHFGKFYRICNDGLVYKETEAYVKFNLGEYRTETALHSLANHIALLRNPKNNLKDINTRSSGNFPCMELREEPVKLCSEE